MEIEVGDSKTNLEFLYSGALRIISTKTCWLNAKISEISKRKPPLNL